VEYIELRRVRVRGRGRGRVGGRAGAVAWAKVGSAGGAWVRRGRRGSRGRGRGRGRGMFRLRAEGGRFWKAETWWDPYGMRGDRCNVISKGLVSLAQ